MTVFLNVSWDYKLILISFGVAYAAAYMGVSLSEQYRLCTSEEHASTLLNPTATLLCIAVCLGGVAIWCMHFVGMGSMTLYADISGTLTPVTMKLDAGITALSFFASVLCLYCGLYISSRDRAFSKNRTEITEMMKAEAKGMSIKELRNARLLILKTLLRGPGHLLAGGVVCGGGVCVMHYIGMEAVRFPGHIEWNVGIVTASVIIAVVASSAAFWILFRFLALFPHMEWLRIASGVIMAAAVCGMHYTGMAAASYVYDPSLAVVPTPGLTGDTEVSMMGAVELGLALCFIFLWLMVTLNLADLRRWNHYNEELIKQVDTMMLTAESSKSSSAQTLEVLLAGYMRMKHRRDAAISNSQVASKRGSFGIGSNKNSDCHPGGGGGIGSFLQTKHPSKVQVACWGDDSPHDKAAIAITDAIENAKSALTGMDHHPTGDMITHPSSSGSFYSIHKPPALSLHYAGAAGSASPLVQSPRSTKPTIRPSPLVMVTPTAGASPLVLEDASRFV